MTRVKICCISSLEEARVAIHYGAAALGLVGAMPSGPGVISNELIKTIALKTPPPIATFLLTSETKAEAVIAHHRKVNTNTIQLVDALEDEDYQLIRNAIPNVKLVQVIHVNGVFSIDEALSISPMVDALLLDSGDPAAPPKILGGTGRTHDWEISRKIVDQSQIPVFLAGGLNADNVRAAIDKVQPFGVDLCSGVRTNNQLDSDKLEAFFNAIR